MEAPLLDELDGLAPLAQRRRLTSHYAAMLDQPTTEWLADAVEAFDALHLDVTSRRKVVSDLAWRARQRGAPIVLDGDVGLSGAIALHHAWHLGARLRFDFRFGDMHVKASRWRHQHPDDALILAFEAFAELGMQHERGVQLFDAALKAPDCDDRVEFTLLHGVWFATEIPDQGERLLALADQMLAAGINDHVLHYRRAFALRRLGDTRAALRSIDDAVAALDPEADGFIQIHQDYVRERELIVATALIGEESARVLAEVKTELETAVRSEVTAAQATISESLLKLIEVLGLFVTLAGFVAASGVSLVRAEEWWQSLLTVLVAGAGALAFFFALRVVVRFRDGAISTWWRRRRDPR